MDSNTGMFAKEPNHDRSPLDPSHRKSVEHILDMFPKESNQNNSSKRSIGVNQAHRYSSMDTEAIQRQIDQKLRETINSKRRNDESSNSQISSRMRGRRASGLRTSRVSNSLEIQEEP